ncbi:MAG: PDZ domain-containing protein, partial [Planctomycetales bacterium]|nr:PDZ domain-containing protein [Planctomycetales bacterium]
MGFGRKMHNVRIITALWIGLLTCLSGRASDIPGRVTDVQDDTIRIVLDTPATPMVGDKVQVFIIIEGLGEEASVATGRITQVTDDYLLAKIEKASSQVETHQRVRIASDVPPNLNPVESNAEGWLGIRVAHVTVDGVRRVGSSAGAFVEGVFPSVAEDEQTLRVGDVLLRMDGKIVRGPEDFDEKIAGRSEGERVRLVLNRNGDQLEFEIS